MKPKPTPSQPPVDELQLFQSHFDQLLNPTHPLVTLAKQIDWDHFDDTFGELYCETDRAYCGLWINVSLAAAGASYCGCRIPDRLDPTNSRNMSAAHSAEDNAHLPCVCSPAATCHIHCRIF